MALLPAEPDEISAQIDQAGNVTVVWTDRSSAPGRILASRYGVAAGSWSAPEVLAEDTYDLGLSAPETGIDGQGNVVVAWTRGINKYPGEATVVFAGRYDVSAGKWSAPSDLGELEAYSRTMALCVGRSGEALVVFRYYRKLRTRRFSPATKSWAPVQELPVGGIPGLVRCGLHESGDLDVVWRSFESTSGQYEDVIRARRHHAASQSWGAESAVDSEHHRVRALRLVTGAGGRAVAIWVRLDAQKREDVWSSVYTPASGTWAATKRMETSGQPQIAPQLLADAAGNAFAVWRSRETSVSSAFARRFSVASETWTDAVELGRGRALGDPVLAVERGGDALVLWHQADPKVGGGSLWRVWGRAYLHEAGRWLPAEAMSPESHAARLPAAALSGSRGVAIWAVAGEPSSLMARHLEGAP